MAKVRLKTEAVDRSGGEAVMKGPGDVIECDEKTAKYIVAQGRGEIVKEKASEPARAEGQPEAAVVAPPEAAIKPQARPKRPGKAKEKE